eukprot:COSAG02_NODE_1812_length_10792_cov_36.615205_5_plen_641_part_00
MACYSDTGNDSASEFSIAPSTVDSCSEFLDPNTPYRCEPLAPRAVEPFQSSRPNGDLHTYPPQAALSVAGAVHSRMLVPPSPSAPPSGWQNPVCGQTEPMLKTEPLVSTQTRWATDISAECTRSTQAYLTAARKPLGGPNAAVGMLDPSPQAYMMSTQPAQHRGVPQTSTCFPGQHGPPPTSANFQDSVPAGISRQDGPLVCPLCERQCESHHRLGFFWRKFGYNGPAYCSRCSSVFRAHMVTRTVSNDKCARDQPCERCELILSKFKNSRNEAFAAMDSCEAKKPQVEKAPPPQEVISCPHCADQVPANTLGVFWRKFGYSGKPYCANCSAKFRNHIIRQRRTRTKDCSRSAPCTVCDSILHSFGPERDTTFTLIDSKSRAPLHGTAAATATGSDSGGDTSGRGGSTGLEALAVKRRKLSARNTTGALAGTLPLAIMGMLAFCAITGLVALWSSDDPQGGAGEFDVQEVPWCSGVDQPRGMVRSKFSVCRGPPLSTCEFECYEAYEPVGNLTCLPGNTEFTGGKCVPSAQRAIEALAMEHLQENMYVDAKGFCKGGATRGMVEDEVDACFGEPGSTCSYRCKPGFVANGTLTCYEEEQVYTGAQCELDAAGALHAAEGLRKDVSDPSDARATADGQVVV